MGRNRERQQELQPGRVDYARTRLLSLGYPVTEIDATTLQFTFRGCPVTLYPYSGWFTGKTVKDGRGIHNLLKQIPMRWALRKQDKIKAHFEPNGDEMLERIKKSLADAFATYIDIERHIETVDGEPYPVLSVGDAGNTSNLVVFYVVRKQYDVYTLAFKEFVG